MRLGWVHHPVDDPGAPMVRPNRTHDRPRHVMPLKEIPMSTQKDATTFTAAANTALLDELNWSDTTDFELARRGFITFSPQHLYRGGDRFLFE